MSHYIAMWSGPRNISTALMRSFENRSDCFVSDEPFYPFFLDQTGFDHPLRDKVIKAGEINYDKIIEYITGFIPNSNTIWYQKHMAHHILPGFNLEWTGKMKNCLLIRHPSDVISSYLKKNKIINIQQLGYVQQFDIYKRFYQRDKTLPIIIDAQELLLNPKRMLTILCDKLGISFDNQMLSWPRGHRETDGIWGKYWYGQVEASTGFTPYSPRKNDIPSKYKLLYNECIHYYDLLYQNRIRLQ